MESSFDSYEITFGWKNVNLLYYEATFKHEMKERANHTGHSTTLQAAKIACKANVNNLMIGHFSQRYKDTNLPLLKYVLYSR